MSNIEAMVWATHVGKEPGQFPTPTAKYVAAALARRAWATGNCHWSQTALARDTGLSARTIWSAIQALVKAKIIRREKKYLHNLRRADRLIFTLRSVTLTLEPDDGEDGAFDLAGFANSASTASQELRGERLAISARRKHSEHEEDILGEGARDLFGGEAPKVTKAAAVVDATFEAWWALYPRKVAKGAARVAYAVAVKKIGVDRAAAVLLAGVEQLAADMADAESTFIPHAATWLNQEGWNDEPGARRSSGGRGAGPGGGGRPAAGGGERQDRIAAMHAGAMAALDRRR